MLAVCAWRQPGRTFEQAPEERRILIADLPANLIDRSVGAFKPALGVLNTQMLHVGNRGDASRFRKSALKRTFGELRAFDQFFDRIGNSEILTQPLLRALDSCITMVGFALEDDVRSE